MTKPELLLENPMRFAYAMHPRILGALIPQKTVGTYVLLDGTKPIYVGRSDNCLLTRLRKHEHAMLSTHVVWEPVGNADKAYLLESEWYHQFSEKYGLRNQVHPARPKNGARGCCPFCQSQDEEGLKEALALKSETVFAKR